MNIESINPDRTAFRCLPASAEEPRVLSPWLLRWQTEFANRCPRINSQQQGALARLLPTLACGEQSAIIVFRNEKERQFKMQKNVSAAIIQSIAADEIQHDYGLQRLISSVGAAQDLHQIKRRAQQFFSGLGRTRSVAQHFSQIAALDRAICILMHSIEQSDVDAKSMFGTLFGRIKLDEARHVNVCRRHARALGMTKEGQYFESRRIYQGLFQLLSPLGGAFDDIGIDLVAVFARIQKRHSHDSAFCIE